MSCVKVPFLFGGMNPPRRSFSLQGVTPPRQVSSQDVQIMEPLPKGLKPELMPKHIAIILDGNRRWANKKGLPFQLSHQKGRRVALDTVFLCCKWGIEVVSIFVFSTENWGRSNEQVKALMGLFEEAIQSDQEELMRYNLRISFIGDKSKLPKSLQKLITSVENATRGNKGLHFMIAINYSGRYDIIQATKSIATKVKDGIFQVEDINEALFDEELETKLAKFPHPDLLIRTSGEQRISNFFLWQLAYSEIFFLEKNFPEFEEEDLIAALISFQKRERRYGGR